MGPRRLLSSVALCNCRHGRVHCVPLLTAVVHCNSRHISLSFSLSLSLSLSLYFALWRRRSVLINVRCHRHLQRDDESESRRISKGLSSHIDDSGFRGVTRIKEPGGSGRAERELKVEAGRVSWR
jgi:hypothetical protein